MTPDTKETDKPVAVEVYDTQRQTYQEAGVCVQCSRVPRHEEGGGDEEGAQHCVSFFIIILNS